MLTTCVFIFLVSPMINYISRNVTVLERDRSNVSMYCNAAGRPVAQLSWIRVRDGKTVASGNTLLVSAADRSYRGEYRCVADNGVGNAASKSAYLDVLCKLILILVKLTKVVILKAIARSSP